MVFTRSGRSIYEASSPVSKATFCLSNSTCRNFGGKACTIGKPAYEKQTYRAYRAFRALFFGDHDRQAGTREADLSRLSRFPRTFFSETGGPTASIRSRERPRVGDGQQAAEKIGSRGISAAKAGLIYSSYVRPKGRTLQKSEFFCSRSSPTKPGPLQRQRASKVPLTGFSIIEANNEEEVARLVAGTPCARAKGAIEIRPILAINDEILGHQR
jgi:hypothetical protein